MEVSQQAQDTHQDTSEADALAVCSSSSTHSPTLLLAWGTNDMGQLGLGVNGPDSLVPTQVLVPQHVNAVSLASGTIHAALCTESGDVYTTGCQEDGRLGEDVLTEQPGHFSIVSSLQAYRIIQVACGEAHTAALTHNGVVMTWGRGDMGQLGHGEEFVQLRHPRVLRALKGQSAVQIACGAHHMFALTMAGKVYAWGQNTWGQLGVGTATNAVFQPAQVISLFAKPVVMVACGEAHSLFLTAEGAVYATGRNKDGQLGAIDVTDRAVPHPVQGLDGVRVAYVTGGGDSSAALSCAHELYTWGCNNFGQLGHGSKVRVLLPRLVAFFEGKKVELVAMATHHSAAVVENHLLYMWGAGASGCLGIGTEDDHDTPILVPSLTGMPITLLSCGLYFNLAVVANTDSAESASSSKQQMTTVLDASRVLRPLERGDTDQVIRMLTAAFSYPGPLNGSFLKRGVGGMSSPDRFGVDLLEVRQVMDAIETLGNESVNHALLSASNRLLGLLQAKTSLLDTPTTLNQILILMELPGFSHEEIFEKVCRIIERLPHTSRQVLVTWWSKYPSEFFARLVRVLNAFVSQRLRQLSVVDGCIASVTMTLDLLCTANDRASIIPYEMFYNTNISEKVDLINDYQLWKNRSGFSFCKYPFMLDANAKSRILHIDAAFQMEHEAERSFIETIFSNRPASSFVVLNVRRTHLIEDTFRELTSHSLQELKKPLRVVFVGEEGVDEGGVRKEYFQLIVRELFDLDYGMFIYDNDSRYYWFNGDSLETDQEYQVIGMIMGLAIYNAIILDVHLPLVTYRKIKKLRPTLTDLKELNPALGKGLQQLLDFEGDVESVFCRSFQVSFESFGQVKTIDLKPGGSEIPVTNDNRKEYVDLYVSFLLDTWVKTQFNAFTRGFLAVAGSELLEDMFRPEELERLICGSEELDFEAWERGARYEGGFTKDHSTIRSFWNVVHGMKPDERSLLLAFITGSARAPIKGLEGVPLLILRNGGDTERLPTAHTCFNVLLLPDYSSEEKMRQKLKCAIGNAEGFGLQ